MREKQKMQKLSKEKKEKKEEKRKKIQEPFLKQTLLPPHACSSLPSLMDSLHLHLKSDKAPITSKIIIPIWLITTLILMIFKALNCFLFSVNANKQGIKDSNNYNPSSPIGGSSNFIEIKCGKFWV